ncbi:MAG: tetratricopeptide repeat protein [Planctomycetes bacterium]|nr:tetratricopeptide repeat protein [Planctomycetota bacterium]
MNVARGVLAACLVCSLLRAATAGEASKPIDLGKQAKSILKAHCHRCHGHDGASEGGFNYVLDLGRLVERKKVVAGQPGKSKLLRRIIDTDDPMPPAEEKSRPTKDEIALLRKWIEAGASSADAPTDRPFQSPNDVFEVIRLDLEESPPRDRPFLRYLTLTHLANAGLSDEELLSFRHGVAKLINSLSWGKRIVVPRSIDASGVIQCIDLRDFDWNEKTWEVLLERNPYGVSLDTDANRRIAELTACKLPYVRGDWFVASASRPPLYHDILQLPRSERELERLLRVDTLENLRQERAVRAGFNGSGVSRNNRLIERHESGATVYWKSYDFSGNSGRKNLFAHPLGPGRRDEHFLHDGGEIIFSLPNGLQAYFLADGEGRRIDKGPTAIVSDPRRPDRAVENGLSCMSCHARGIIDKADQVRAHLVKNADAFAAGTLETAMALYPGEEKMLALMRGDARRFQDAVKRTGAPLTATEPIAALAARFEAEIDLPLAAAEVGVRPGELLEALRARPQLAQSLGPLRVAGGTVQRQAFVDSFGDLVEALRIGTHLATRSTAVARLVRKGNALLASDAAEAFKAFAAALELDADEPQAHAGQGETHRLRGDHVRAVEAYSRAIRLDPRLPVLFNNRGLALHAQGKAEDAVADFTAALRLNPRFATAYHNRGAVALAQGELEKAIDDFDEVLRLQPHSPRAHNDRGYAHLERKQFGKAMADFNRAIALDGKLAAAWNNRGLGHLRQDEPAPAIRDFSRAIELRPDFAHAYFNRSVAYSRQGETARAAADRRRAIQLDPSLDKE